MVEKRYIIDGTHFFGVLSLGQNTQYTAPDAGGVTNAANRYSLAAQIAAFEPQYCRAMFGEEMTEALYRYLRRDDVQEVEERWERLLSLLRGNDSYLSPVAAFVYFRILETRAGHVTETGVRLGAGSDVTTAVPFQVQAWGLMCETNKEVKKLLGTLFNDFAPLSNPAMFERVNSLGL